VQRVRDICYVWAIFLCSAAFFCAPVRADKLLVTPEALAAADQIYSGDLEGGREAALRLQQEQPEWLRGGRQISLLAMDILQGFDPSEIALIETILLEKRYHAGEIIIREGDSADSLYLLASGRVSICLSLRARALRQRLSTISPGVAFGELALLDGGKRSADAIADEPALCYVLPIDKLQELAKHHPNIESKLIFNIGRELSARLRRADAEIRALAD